MSFKYLDFRKQTSTSDINEIFPGWEPGKEKVAIFSPHDDDALIGAGYVIEAVKANGGDIAIFVFCDGDCGYSDPALKDTIAQIRKKETLDAYKYLGITMDNIVYFGLPDFSAWTYIGYRLNAGEFGSLVPIFENIRQKKITRVLVPNGYREHVDHEAVYRMGAYDAVQAGDPVMVDHGAPQEIKSFLQYSVWADFDPSDALVTGSDTGIRANKAVLVSEDVEKTINEALFKYATQYEAIKNLIKNRQERKSKYGYLELYIAFDPRPKLEFAPYIESAEKFVK